MLPTNNDGIHLVNCILISLKIPCAFVTLYIPWSIWIKHKASRMVLNSRAVVVLFQVLG